MSWDGDFRDQLQAASLKPAARGPATLGEVWKSEWSAASLDALSGVAEPMEVSLEELRRRTADITGRNVMDLARDRGLDYLGRSFDGKVDTLAKIVDSLPDQQSKLLQDYKDVRGRARKRAADTLAEADEIRANQRGLTPMAVGFAAQAARAIVDPVNLALAPLGGPAKGPALKWLGREFLIGAGTQAVQEPGIRFRREELGLESSSIENVLTAGLAQAGFAGLFKAAGAAVPRVVDAVRGGSEWRVGAEMQQLIDSGSFDPAAIERAALRPQGDFPMEGQRLPLQDRPTADQQAQARLDAAAPVSGPRERLPGLSPEETAQLDALSPQDFAALARHAEADALTDQLAGSTPAQQMRFQDATRFMNEGGAMPAATPGLSFDGIQQVIRPDGNRLGVRYALVERGSIQTSHSADGVLNPDYPQALQPRDRARGVSSDQINQIAANLQPELLMHSPVLDHGAPLVGPDGLVESGNGRVLAIETAYRRNPETAQAYRQKLDDMGFDTAGMNEPVLVRIRMDELTPADRVKLTVEGNKPAVAGLSATERAFTDARMLDDSAMQLWMGGNVSDARNAPFVRGFVDRALGQTERNGAIDSNGRLSQEGARRIEAALVAKAWESKAVVQALTEATDEEARAILGAMADVSPSVAQLKAAIADGRVPLEVDPTRPLLSAYELVAKARKEGRPVRELLDQADIEKGMVKPDVEAAVRLFYADDDLTQAASRKRVAERMDHAVSRALMHQGGGLFGDAADAGQFLRAARFAGENLSNVELGRVMTAAAEKPNAEGQPATGNRQLADDAVAALPPEPVAAPKPEPKPQDKIDPKPAAPDPIAVRMDAVLVEAGGEMTLHVPRPDGTLEAVPARTMMQRLADERTAITELTDCIARAGGGIAA